MSYRCAHVPPSHERVALEETPDVMFIGEK
jgi:hypothetical protein